MVADKNSTTHNLCACGEKKRVTSEHCRACFRRGYTGTIPGLGDVENSGRKKPTRKAMRPATPESIKWLESPIKSCAFCFRKGRWDGYYCPDHENYEELNHGYVEDEE